MKIYPLKIQDVKILTPNKFDDSRGFFSETYNKNTLLENDINIDFVQDNHSNTLHKNVIRGLHFQTEPFAQDKLVRVISGSILDVAVDIRKDSPTFGEHVTKKISAENFEQILVPKGFAHGFLTLEDNTSVIYKVSNYYSPENDKGIIWNDDDLSIDWGVDKSEEIFLSEKDSIQPSFHDCQKELF